MNGRVVMGRDVATVTVAVCLALMLAWIAYVRISRPRHDPWQPVELSSKLEPPFNPQGNGVRKC